MIPSIDEIAALRALIPRGFEMRIDCDTFRALLDAAEEALRLKKIATTRHDELHAMAAERDRLREGHLHWKAEAHRLAAERDRLAAAHVHAVEMIEGFAHENRRLAAALRRYGRHDQCCHDELPCSCGLVAALHGTP